MRGNRRRDRWFPYVVIALLLAILAAGTATNLVRNPQPRLVADGVPGDAASATRRFRPPEREVRGPGPARAR